MAVLTSRTEAIDDYKEYKLKVLSPKTALRVK